MNAGVNLHFPSYIYFAYDIMSKGDHKKLLEKCDEIRSNVLKPSTNWFCDVLTSYNEKSLANEYPFKDLISSIEKHIIEFCGFLNSNPSTIIADHAWINSSSLGQYQEQHTHPNSNISAIYYLKAPEGSAATIFKSPYQKQNTLNIKQFNDVTYQEIRYKPEEGKLILFESHLPHLTERHSIDQERMTFAANFTVR